MICHEIRNFRLFFIWASFWEGVVVTFLSTNDIMSDFQNASIFMEHNIRYAKLSYFFIILPGIILFGGFLDKKITAVCCKIRLWGTSRTRVTNIVCSVACSLYWQEKLWSVKIFQFSSSQQLQYLGSFCQ